MAVESGPAAGVVAAALVARQTGRRNLLSFDMGGTTAKASLIRDGQYETTPEYEVGGGASGNRWMHGTGHPIRVPVIDLAEVSAGGGSIAWVDRAGALRVGPKSAGAEPGPVCYGRGGTEPTVTDCNLLLGYLDKGSLLAGDLPIDHAAAEAAVAERLAEPLGVDVRTAAAAVIDVVNHAMAEALKIVSVQRGHDPREFVLAAFGGAGPAACRRAGRRARHRRGASARRSRARSRRSAWSARDLKRDYVRTVYTTTATADPAALEAAFAALEARGRRHARPRRRRAGAPPLRALRRCALRAPILRAVDAGCRRARSMQPRWREIAETFHDRHRATYGHDNRAEPVQLVSVRLTAIGAIPPLPIRDKTARRRHRRRQERARSVWFRDTGAVDATVYDRARMPAELVLRGPGRDRVARSPRSSCRPAGRRA